MIYRTMYYVINVYITVIISNIIVGDKRASVSSLVWVAIHCLINLFIHQFMFYNGIYK